MKSVGLLIVLSLFASISFSQVIIREKVEIKPTVPSRATANAAASTNPLILVDSYVSAHVFASSLYPFTKVVLNGHTFYDHTPTRVSEFVGSVYGSFELPAQSELTAGITQFVSYSYTTPPYDWVPFDIVIYQHTMAGGGVQSRAHTELQLVSASPYAGYATVDYSVDSKLQRLQPSSAKATIGPGEETTITLEPIPTMSPGDLMPVTITINGPCHVIINGVDYGKAWVGQWGDVKSGFAVVGDADPPDGKTSAQIIIDTRLATERTGDVTITVENPFCVKIIAEKSPLAPGDTTLLTFKKIRSNGDVVDFPAGQPFDVHIVATDSSKGLLLSGGIADVALSFVSEPIQYIAPATITEDSIKAMIVAIPITIIENAAGKVTAPTVSQSVKGNFTQTSEGLKKLLENNSCPINSVTVTAEKPILKILDHSPWTIWPLLPPQNNGMSRGADQPGYNPKRGFTIKLVDRSNNPLANQKVTITTSFEKQSGGHTHNWDTGIKELPHSLQGKFSGQGHEGNPLDLSTDVQGLAVVDEFTAPEHSGKFLITASLKDDATVKDTVNLTIKVPGLVNFRDKIVGPTPIWTYDQSDSGQANHPSNNWCTLEMADSLFFSITDFYEWTTTPKGGGNAVILSLNDMSLEYVGHYDNNADWRLPNNHSFHRVGLSVDINNTGLKNGDGFTDSGNQLILFMKKYGGIKYREPQIHFGFNGGY